MSRAELARKVFPFLQWWPQVNKRTLRADLLAGFTGAVVVLPQGVAFAMIAGLPPIYGLYTAMVTPIIAGLFGSSMHLISGPNTAISIVIFAALSQIAEPGSVNYIHLALAITLMAGIFQFVLGLARMGSLINFVSHVVVVGFSAGAALLIATSQMKQVLGIEISGNAAFITTWLQLFQHLLEINPFVFLVAMGTLATAILVKKILPRAPHFLFAMVVGSALGYWLGGEANGIHLIGELPGRLPPFSVPDVSFSNIRTLAPNSFAIAMLGLIQSIAIAKSISIRSQQMLDNNQELIGQGLSNIVGSFFSSYAGAGSFTRSGINFDSGAFSPLSAVFSSIILLLMVLLIAPLTAHLPIAAMAGIILLVAYNLIDFDQIKTVFRASKRQSIVLIVTFFSTLFFDLEFAVYFGVLTSLVFYLQRTSQPNVAVMAPNPDDPRRRFFNLEREDLKECPQLKIIRIDGSLFFGAINHISLEIERLTDDDDLHLLIIANGINFVDVAGSEWLTQQALRYRRNGGGLYISGLKWIAQDTLIKGGYKEIIGEENFFATKAEAIPAIFAKLDKSVCATCTARIFKECNFEKNGVA